MRNRLFVLGALLVAACATSAPAPEPRPYNPELLRQEMKEPIGVFLSRTDGTINAWNHLMLTADKPDDRFKVRELEEVLQNETYKRREELIEQLASGPPFNRIVAAVALGFTDSNMALSPLLAALDDPEPQVVNNALLGLALLHRKETPLEGIVAQLEHGRDEEGRVNAAYAITQILDQGAEGDEDVLRAARIGLRDQAPTVRCQCVLILARMKDSDSIDVIDLALYDEVPLVSAAAARALAHIGTVDPHVKGECARLLSAAYNTIDTTTMEASLLRALRDLSKANFGEEAEDWIEWANRLP